MEQDRSNELDAKVTHQILQEVLEGADITPEAAQFADRIASFYLSHIATRASAISKTDSVLSEHVIASLIVNGTGDYVPVFHNAIETADKESGDKSESLLHKRKRSSFCRKVRDVVSEIPAGKVMTYKEVAAAAGSPSAYRAVGSIMHNNDNPKEVPCHRVVACDGSLAGYGYGGIKVKKTILEAEGVAFNGDKVKLNNK